MKTTQTLLKVTLPVMAALLVLTHPVHAAPTSYQNRVISDGPFLYYELGETSGTTANDSSVNGFSGTYTNDPSAGGYTLGQPGDNVGGASDDAVLFDGANGYVAVAPGVTNFGLYLYQSSYEFVFQTTDTTDTSYLMGEESVNLGGGSYDSFGKLTAAVSINLNAAGGPVVANECRIYIRDFTGANNFGGGFVNTNVCNGAYHHLVFTFSYLPTNTITAYLDGVVQPITDYAITGTGITNSAFTNAFDETMFVGAEDARGTAGPSGNLNLPTYFHGTIDEAAIYTNVLTATQVTTHYAILQGAKLQINSLVPSTTNPQRGQNVTVTATVTYFGTTPSTTATLNASGLNSAASAVAMAQQSYNVGTGVAVYTNTVTVSGSAVFGPTNLTVVASDTAGDLSTNSVAVTVTLPVLVSSVVPSTTTPVRTQNVTVTANISYAPGFTPNTVTLNASGLNPADSALALVQQSFNVGTGAAVYTNTLTVDPSVPTGATTLTVVASDTVGDLGTNTVAVTVTASTQVWNGAGFTNNGVGNWSDNTNWVSGIAPLPTYDNVTFAGTNGLNNTNDFVTSVANIKFNNGAGAFNLLGNPLKITGTTIASDNNATNPETITIATTWVAATNSNLTIASAPGATLTFAGNVDMTATNVSAANINLNAGNTNANGGPTVLQFGGTVNINGLTYTNDAPITPSGFTMRQDTIMNLLAGSVMNVKGGYINVGQNTSLGAGIGTSNHMSYLNVMSGATLNLASNTDFSAGANYNHAANEYEWGTININGTLNAALGPNTDGWGFIRLGIITVNANTLSGGVDNGTINLNSGGSLVTSRQIVSGGTFIAAAQGNGHLGVKGIFNFNGGTLKTDGVNPVNDDWLESFNSSPVNSTIAALSAVTIGPLGAFIDTAGQNATIGATLTQSNSVPDGGLTKLGLGTLTLLGANTYTGTTTIGAGTLALGVGGFTSGQIDGSVVIAGGATLDVSALSPYTLLGNKFTFGGAVPSTNNGALNVPLTTTNVLNYTNNAIPALVATGGALTFNGTSFVVNGPVLPTGSYTVITVANSGSVTNNATNVVTGVTGTAIGASVAQIKFNAAATTAILLVTNTVSLNPATANFAAVLVGGGTALHFTWASDHQGWQLYTNSVGLGTANWFPVPGSASVTSETININPARPQVFFQLRYP